MKNHTWISGTANGQIAVIGTDKGIRLEVAEDERYVTLEMSHIIAQSLADAILANLPQQSIAAANTGGPDMSGPDDIVARLRRRYLTPPDPPGLEIFAEAADEIDSLRARLSAAEREYHEDQKKLSLILRLSVAATTLLTRERDEALAKGWREMKDRAMAALAEYADDHALSIVRDIPDRPAPTESNT